MAKEFTPIENISQFNSNWVGIVLKALFSVEYKHIYFQQERKPNEEIDYTVIPTKVNEVGEKILNNIFNDIVSVTSVSETELHSFMVVTHQLNKVTIRFRRTGIVSNMEELSFSFLNGLRICFVSGDIRKVYASDNPEELTRVFIFQQYIFNWLVNEKSDFVLKTFDNPQ